MSPSASSGGVRGGCIGFGFSGTDGGVAETGGKGGITTGAGAGVGVGVGGIKGFGLTTNTYLFF